MDQQLAQTTIDDAISRQFNWTAELYFSDIKNSNGDPIDLFHYTNKEIYKQQRSSQVERSPCVIFDRNKYPPNKDGLRKLCIAIKTEGIKYGTNLISRNNPLVLSCYRCKKHSSKVKGLRRTSGDCDGENKENARDVDTDILVEHGVCLNGVHSHQYDQDGILLGIRSYQLHRDRHNARADGKYAIRGTCTMRPTNSTDTCQVSLRLGIQEGTNGYIYLKQGCGKATHTFHPKPRQGDL